MRTQFLKLLLGEHLKYTRATLSHTVCARNVQQAAWFIVGTIQNEWNTNLLTSNENETHL